MIKVFLLLVFAINIANLIAQGILDEGVHYFSPFKM